MPLVTVVLPTYNRAHTLARAIESVLAQTLTDFELVVVDDGSTDATHSVLSRYAGARNVRILNTAHRGCSAARNTGIRDSSSPYVAFQDSDDEWVPTRLSAAVAALESVGPQTGMFYSNMTRVHSDGAAVPFCSPDVQRGRVIDDRTLDYQVLGIGIQSALIRRSCFARVGLFDETLPRFIDLDLFIRLADEFHVIHQRDALVRYHESPGISTDTQALVVARRHLLMKYRARLAQNRQHVAMQHLFLAKALRANGNEYLSGVSVVRALCTSRRPWIGQQALRLLGNTGRDAFHGRPATTTATALLSR